MYLKLVCVSKLSGVLLNIRREWECSESCREQWDRISRVFGEGELIVRRAMWEHGYSATSHPTVNERATPFAVPPNLEMQTWPKFPYNLFNKNSKAVFKKTHASKCYFQPLTLKPASYNAIIYTKTIPTSVPCKNGLFKASEEHAV